MCVFFPSSKGFCSLGNRRGSAPINKFLFCLPTLLQRVSMNNTFVVCDVISENEGEDGSRVWI